MSKHLERLLHVLVGLTFLVPLVVMPATFIFPFIVPKILLFRTLVLLMSGTYVLLLVAHWREWRPRLSPTTILVLAFLASFALSTFAGVDWYRSFWDNHERMLGLFTITHYVLYYLIVTSTIKEWKDWRWLLRLLVLSASVVMFIAFLQKGSPDLLLNRGAGRVSSTLGNPIYLGGYGLFLCFLGVLLALREQVMSWRIVAYTGAGLGFLAIFLSGTRGAVLGLAAGLWVLCLMYALVLRDHRQVRQACIVALCASIALFGVLFFFRQTSLVRSIPALGGLLNTTLTGDSAGTRLLAWGIAIEAWQERPLIGWGPNNFYYAFNQHYRPQFLEYGWGETWFDNAHNILLNTLAVQGAIGFIVYLLLFFVTAAVMVRRAWRVQLDVHVASIGTAFLAAHLVQNIFVFENPTSYLYFFFFLAFLNSQIGVAQASNPPAVPEGHRISWGSILPVGFVILLLIYATNLNPARANTATLKTIQLTYQGRDPRQAYLESVAIPTPHVDDIRNDFARGVYEVLPTYIEGKRLDEAKGIFLLAFDELNKNRILHPLDIRAHIQQGQLAQQFGPTVTQDPRWYLVAEEIFADALAKSPKRQQLKYLLAGAKMIVGKPDESVALLRQTIDDDPKVDEGWWRLAILYYEMGRRDDARTLIAEAKANGIVFRGTGAEVVDTILSSTSTVTSVK